MAAVDDDVIPLAEKLEFFRRASHCFGRTALMLSGAGALGPFHVGVIKALLEQDLLPNVISGSSAGSLVAAIVGTRDDAQRCARSSTAHHRQGLRRGRRGRGGSLKGNRRSASRRCAASSSTRFPT
jgi:predicted acylesterase/phospholipase RssA